VDRSQLLRGALDAAALAVVAQQDGYGYDVVRRLRAAGLTDVGDASVYGTLRRLYRAGALTSYVMPSDEGPHRRYYGITDRGRAQLGEARIAWAGFARTLTMLLETDVEVPASARRPPVHGLGPADRHRPQ
jgi:PadR family transcriptional regulator PadR